MPRVLKRSTIDLANGVHCQAVPYPVSKGRHWIATNSAGKIVGEFKSRQRNTYTRQPPGKEHYGRGGGTYASLMVRASWVEGQILEGKSESMRHPNEIRTFNEWKNLLRELPDPAVRVLKPALAG